MLSGSPASLSTLLLAPLQEAADGGMGGVNLSPTRGFFVTGTDTGVGKTLVAIVLTVGLRRRGFSVGVMKPVASGAGPYKDRSGRDSLVAEDTILLHKAVDGTQHLAEITPCAYQIPASPHLAARESGTQVDKNSILAAFRELAGRYHILVVEGVGGLLVPLRDDWLVIDMAKSFGLPLLLVARSGLGTLNHTFLTLEAARNRGLDVAGVVVNQAVQPDPYPPDSTSSKIELDNIQTIRRLGHVPILGTIPYIPSLERSDPVAMYKRIESFIRWEEITSFVS